MSAEIESKMNVGLNESDIELSKRINKEGDCRRPAVHIAKIAKLNARKLFAVKVYENTAEMTVKFRTEYDILKAIDNNFVVKMYDAIESTKSLYIVMDLYQGGNLHQLLTRWVTFGETTARFYAASMIEPIDYLHRNQIIHRDITLDNFLIDRHGYLKLCDFSYSLMIRGEQDCDNEYAFAIDYWSLGICIYYMLMGKLPITFPEDGSSINFTIGFADDDDQSLIDEVYFEDARDLIYNLSRTEPTERLGVKTDRFVTVRKHKWFEKFDFEALRAQTVQPPIVPHIKNDLDPTYCQTDFRVEAAKFLQTFKLFS